MTVWRQGGLLWQFAAVSLAVVALLGVGLGSLMASMLEENALVQASDEAAQTVSLRLPRHLSPEDFHFPMQDQRYDELSRIFEDSIVYGRTVRIKLWNKDKTVVFSDNRQEMGQSYPHKEDLTAALSGKTVREVSNLEEPEHQGERHYGRLMEVYAPVVLPGSDEVVGAFEVYLLYEPLAQSIDHARFDLYVSLSVGLLIFYAAVFVIVKRGHDTIRRQQSQQAAAFAVERRLRTHLQTLNEAALMVAAELELEPLLQRIVELASQFVAARYAALVVLDSQGTLQHFVTLGLSEADKAAIGRLLINEGMLALTTEGRRPVRMRDFRQHPSALGLPTHHPEITSLLGVPICLGERMVGCIYVANKEVEPKFNQEDQDFLERLAAHAALAIEKSSLLATVEQRARALKDAYSSTLEALSAALDLRDGGTEKHSQRATERMQALAQAMGVPPEEREHMVMGALLHDIGKIGVPDAILRKPGPLTPDEWDLMRRHSQLGYEMLASIRFLLGATPIVRHHHESYDGRGYPDGLVGDQIPLGARIFAVLDTYDAITSDRPYRKGRSHQEAVDEIVRCAGTQFDPQVVNAFLRIADQLADPSQLRPLAPATRMKAKRAAMLLTERGLARRA